MLNNVKVVIPCLLVLRLLIFASPLPSLLQDDQQLTSPLTAFPRLKEGIYLFDIGVDPYSGGVFRHSPIILALFSTVFSVTPVFSAILWTAFDGIAAWALSQIWRYRSKAGQQPSVNRESLVVALYLLNPYLFLPNLAKSTASLDNALTLLSIMFASQGKSSPALLFASLLVHSSLTCILLVPPLLLLLIHPTGPAPPPIPTNEEKDTLEPKCASVKELSLLFVEFLAYMAVLSILSFFLVDGWTWIERTWGAVILLPDLTPNPGLWWYFFTEMFDHFRPFFLMAFSVHLLIYVAPICIKFSHDPLYAIFVLQGVIATFKSYPTLADPGLFVSMFTIFPEIFPFMRHPLVTILLQLHAVLLLPLFNSLWLSQGTGNANFYYASTLVFGLGMAAAVNDAVWSGLRVRFGPQRKGWQMMQL